MSKQSLKPFNLEKAIGGAKIYTRSGNKVRLLCCDRISEDFPLVGLVCYEVEGTPSMELVQTFKADGTVTLGGTEHEHDLFLKD